MPAHAKMRIVGDKNCLKKITNIAKRVEGH